MTRRRSRTIIREPEDLGDGIFDARKGERSESDSISMRIGSLS